MEKMKRKRDEKEADAKILDLLDKDGGSTQGGKYLELARRQQRAEEREKENERKAEKKKSSGKGMKRKDVVSSEEEVDREEDEGRKRKKSAFKPEHIKAIGFDPTMLATGAIRAEETPAEKRLRVRVLKPSLPLGSRPDPPYVRSFLPTAAIYLAPHQERHGRRRLAQPGADRWTTTQEWMVLGPSA